ncbi:thioredoxin-like-domain-containing protein [Obelidium mucronatum]|nr:thioredoxin-like-domain-containing protein [Obelidium mucronatum]
MSKTVNFSELLGPTLQNQSAEVSLDSVVHNSRKKVIGLLFSASWCPPCRLFGPKLKELYANKSSELEIVLIGSDKDEASHKAYFESMPWLSTPFNTEKTNQISAALNINGIPALHLFNAHDGSLITDNAVSHIFKDPQGVFYPYGTKSIHSVLDVIQLVDHTSTRIVDPASIIRNKKNLAFFFDTTVFEKPWWGMCRGDCGVMQQYGDSYECTECAQFKLCEVCVAKSAELHKVDGHTFVKTVLPDDEAICKATRDALIAKYSQRCGDDKDDFEVVMISRAKTAEEHAAHAALVPWPVVAFDEHHSVQFYLTGIYDVHVADNASHLLVVDSEYKAVNVDATFALNQGEPIPFKSHKVGDLSKTYYANGIRQGDKPFLVVYASTASPEDLTQIKTVLNNVAERMVPRNPDAVEPGTVVCDGDVCRFVPATETTQELAPRMIIFYDSGKSPSGRGIRGWAGRHFGEDLVSAKETKIDVLAVSFDPPQIQYYNGEITEDSLVKFSEEFLAVKDAESKDEVEATEKSVENPADDKAEVKQIGEDVAPSAEPTVEASSVKKVAQTWTKATKTTTVTTTTESGNKIVKTTTQTVYKANH